MTNQLELDVRAIGRMLYDLQLAYIFKVPEEMKQTPCDFFGFTVNGRAILIECKQVKRTYLPIGKEPGIAPHQWLALKQAHHCSSNALLIWRNGEETAMLKFSEIEPFKESRKSIPWAEIPKVTNLEQAMKEYFINYP